MKRNVLITVLVVVLLTVVFFMVKDLFKDKISEKNSYNHAIDSSATIDSSLFAYKEIKQIKPAINELKAIAIDAHDNVYVTGLEKVIVYDSKGDVKKEINFGDTAYAITISPENEIYLGVRNHIEVWDTTGILIKKWKPRNINSLITSIAINNSSVFVADFTEKNVHHYNRAGKWLKNIAEKDADKGIPGIVLPSPYFDILWGRDNELWVANPGRHSLEAYDDKGNLISSFTKASMDVDGFCGCCNPSNIAMLSDGCFVTAEKALERVKVLSPEGDLKYVVAGPKDFEKGTKGLDLAVDSKDRIYVLDPVRKMIRIFTRK